MIFSFFEGKKRAICNKEALKCLGIDDILYSHKVNILDFFSDDLEVLQRRVSFLEMR